ncbi:class I SAM-dependent methyltransferase [Frateuria defendens]|uniref:class I SAM-dependent methyltransferase n=1 Tax=Frateuria defendens TaxID=2219559 RepID=UPI00066FF2C8|nr:class I SAM-dependent methyltransferase [Frateuria defendens]
MLKRDHDIYASQPMRRLLADETAALTPELRRSAGTWALQVSAASVDPTPSLPTLRGWVNLHVGATRYGGDLAARLDEPLPFLPDTFDLILLRHVLEVVPAPQRVLEEAARVLAPGGLLVLTGMHPLSGWLPWWLWRSRSRRPTLRAPLLLESWLRGADLSIERVQRVGRGWPGAARPGFAASSLGGAYLLLARKRQLARPLIRIRPRAVPDPVGAGLAPGARRSAAA